MVLIQIPLPNCLTISHRSQKHVKRFYPSYLPTTSMEYQVSSMEDLKIPMDYSWTWMRRWQSFEGDGSQNKIFLRNK